MSVNNFFPDFLLSTDYTREIMCGILGGIVFILAIIGLIAYR